MKSLRHVLIALTIFAMALGCAPKRMPEEAGEEVFLPQVVPLIITKYQGVRSLQAQVTVKLQVQDEFYLLHGLFLYENPASLRLQLAPNLGPTVGEMIYTDGLLTILVPSEERLYQGWLQDTGPEEEALALTMSFQDYVDAEHGRFPTRVFGETEGGELRFELRLKVPKVDAPVPAGAFVPHTLGWEQRPLADLKELLYYAGGGEKRP
jgi:hypothetical protein